MHEVKQFMSCRLSSVYYGRKGVLGGWGQACLWGSLHVPLRTSASLTTSKMSTVPLNVPLISPFGTSGQDTGPKEGRREGQNVHKECTNVLSFHQHVCGASHCIFTPAFFFCLCQIKVTCSVRNRRITFKLNCILSSKDESKRLLGAVVTDIAI